MSKLRQRDDPTLILIYLFTFYHLYIPHAHASFFVRISEHLEDNLVGHLTKFRLCGIIYVGGEDNPAEPLKQFAQANEREDKEMVWFGIVIMLVANVCRDLMQAEREREERKMNWKVR